MFLHYITNGKIFYIAENSENWSVFIDFSYTQKSLKYCASPLTQPDDPN